MNLVQLLISPSWERIEYTFRLALIITITTYLIMYYQTPEPALTAYLAFFMNKPDRVSSVLSQIVMVVVITIVIAAILLLSMWVIDSSFWRFIAMTGLSIGLLFLGSASKLKPIAGSIALITGYSLSLLGSAPFGEAAVRGLLYAWLFVAIPAGASLIVNLVMGPSPIRLLHQKIEQRLLCILHYVSDPNELSRKRLMELLFEGEEASKKWIKLSALEHSTEKSERERLESLSRLTAEIMTLLSAFDPTEIPDDLFSALRKTIEPLLDDFRKGSPITSMALPSELVQLKSNPQRAFEAERFLTTFRSFNDGVVIAVPPPPKSGFFHADAFTNRVHLQYALKTTAAAMSCYVLYTLMDWPGIHTSFITCYIVSQGSAAESIAKLRLRLGGCLFGAAIGVLVMINVIPYTTSIESLLIIVFIGTLLSGWIAAGSEGVSYAGFQVAFAFYLCVLQGASPAFDLVIARDRVIGILLGNLVAYLFITGFWPISVSDRLDRRLLEWFRSIHGSLNVSSKRTHPRDDEIYAKGGALLAEIELARLEPPEISPAPNALKLREDLIYKGLALKSALLLDEPQVVHDQAALLYELVDQLGRRIEVESHVLANEKLPLQSSPITTPLLSELSELIHRISPLNPHQRHV